MKYKFIRKAKGSILLNVFLSRTEIDMRQVQEQLGHRSYNTTANIYAHVLEEKKSEASNIFDGLLPKKD